MNRSQFGARVLLPAALVGSLVVGGNAPAAQAEQADACVASVILFEDNSWSGETVTFNGTWIADEFEIAHEEQQGKIVAERREQYDGTVKTVHVYYAGAPVMVNGVQCSMAVLNDRAEG